MLCVRDAPSFIHIYNGLFYGKKKYVFLRVWTFLYTYILYIVYNMSWAWNIWFLSSTYTRSSDALCHIPIVLGCDARTNDSTLIAKNLYLWCAVCRRHRDNCARVPPFFLLLLLIYSWAIDARFPYNEPHKSDRAISKDARTIGQF